MPNPLSQFGLTDLELDAAMKTNPLVIAGVEELAHRIEESLKDKAQVFGDRPPKRQGPPDPEHPFKESIHTELIRTKDGMPAARVGSDSPIAMWQEIGTKHFPEDAIFAKTAAEFGDTTGPVMSEEVAQAHGKLREALETLATLKAQGAAAEHIARATKAVAAARQARTSAFKAARGGRRRGGRRGRSR